MRGHRYLRNDGGASYSKGETGLKAGAPKREATKTARRRSHTPHRLDPRFIRALGLPVSTAASCSLIPHSYVLNLPLTRRLRERRQERGRVAPCPLLVGRPPRSAATAPRRRAPRLAGGEDGRGTGTSCPRPPLPGRGEAGTAPPRPGSVSASSNASLLISRTTL